MEAKFESKINGGMVIFLLLVMNFYFILCLLFWKSSRMHFEFHVEKTCKNSIFITFSSCEE